MIKNYKNIYLNSIISALIILFANIVSQAQNTTQIKPDSASEKTGVQWVSQWPTPESKHQKKEVKQQIKELLIGKKKQELSKPVSVLATNQNSFWILDQKNNAIFQVTDGVSKIPHFIEKKNNDFPSLVGICNFSNNKILFTDSYTNKIFVINAEKKECISLNDSLKLDRPTGIAYSSEKKEIWVLETGAHRIVVLNEKGQIIKKIGSRGSGKGEFNFPTHIWIDKIGNAYVVDAMNFRVQIFNKEGEVLSVFGSNGDGPGYFSSPKGIATDSYGNIYVVDALFNVVQIFDMKGNFLYTFGSQGHEDGQFWMPLGIYIDDNDKIYVADSYNSRIQTFQLITGGKQ